MPQRFGMLTRAGLREYCVQFDRVPVDETVERVERFLLAQRCGIGDGPLRASRQMTRNSLLLEWAADGQLWQSTMAIHLSDGRSRMIRQAS
jgi:hypothetical protein